LHSIKKEDEYKRDEQLPWNVVAEVEKQKRASRSQGKTTGGGTAWTSLCSPTGGRTSLEEKERLKTTTKARGV